MLWLLMSTGCCVGLCVVRDPWIRYTAGTMARESKPRSRVPADPPTSPDNRESPSGIRFVRQYQFDQTVYSHFENETAQRGATPGGIFRKVMQDYLGGLYVTVDDLTPETMEELRQYAKNIFGSARNVQAAISAIVNKWAVAEAEKRKR